MRQGDPAAASAYPGRRRAPGGRRPLRVAAVLRRGAAYCAGAVLAAAGLGLAVPHLGKEGVGLLGLTGLAALLGGLALAVLAARRLLTGLRRRWWVPLLPLLLVVAYLALWIVGQGFAAGLPARPSLGDRSPADVGLAYEEVRLPAAGGVELAAWWVPGSNGASVVVLHGAGSTRSAVLDHAAVLAGHGYGVLLLDARGHGESGGRGMDFGWYGEQDVAAALDWLAGRPGQARQVGLVGLSMGGEEAIGAAGVDARVAAVVAEGATNRVAGDKAYLDAYGLRGRLQQQIDRAAYAVAGMLSEAPEPVPLHESVAAASRRGVPFLLVAAGEVPDETLAAERLRRVAPSAVEVWTVTGAAHTGGLDSDPAGWSGRVLTFLDEALLGGGAG